MKREAAYGKIRAVMLGHAVADAVGVPAEFRSREELAKDPITDMTGYGTYGMPAGTWSDDTSMSLAALDVLKDGECDLTAVMKNFIAWAYDEEYNARSVTFDIGMACLSAISDYRFFKPTDPTAHGGRGESSNGNGSLMRIHPFALYIYYTKPDPVSEIELIHKASALTHAHMRSKVACGIYSFILWELLKSPSKAAIKRGLDLARECYKGEKELENFTRLWGNLENLDESDIRSTGYVVDTIEAALWSVLTTNDYKSAVLRAVNLGEDTDTVAAIAGGIAAAFYGIENIPTEWLEGLARREYIEEMCRIAADNWTAKQRD